MADVSAYLDAKVSSDGAGGGGGGVGLAQHDAAGFDDVETLPDHGDDGAGTHVLDESGEERLAGEVGVVLFQQVFGGLQTKNGNMIIFFLTLSNFMANE